MSAYLGKNTKSNGFCFTLNNYSDSDLERCHNISVNPLVRYMVVGKEVGESGTPHLQGYIYFHSRIVFDTVRKLLPPCHIIVAKGDAQSNFEYCSKDGEFEETGDRPVSQKRKGQLGKEFWDHQLQLAKKGRICECDSKLQITHFSSLNAISARYAPMPANLTAPDNLWYYGPTGTGKSFKARSDNPGAYLKMCNKWWDGYQSEDVVIIEDFDKIHSVLGHHLKIWGDCYAFPAEIKGSKLNLRPAKLIVTSNYHPSEIWTDPSTLEPILRRYVVTEFKRTINQVLIPL